MATGMMGNGWQLWNGWQLNAGNGWQECGMDGNQAMDGNRNVGNGWQPGNAGKW